MTGEQEYLPRNHLSNNPVQIEEDKHVSVNVPERVMIFIDGSNLFWTAKRFKLGYRIDLQKLVKELTGQRPLIRPYFYSGVGVPPSEPQIKFHHKLKYSGINVVTRPLRQRGDRWIEKGIDVALVTDMLGMAFRNVYDIAILVSGDRDLAEAIEEVKRLGKRVEIASFESSIAEDMKMIADRFISLDAIANKIQLQVKTP
jgi:uncharacterized LabA/DUF88 family protein